MWVDGEQAELRGIAVSAGGGQAAYSAQTDLGASAAALADPGAVKWAHDAKELETVVRASGGRVAGIAFDTMLAGYLLDPAQGSYPLRMLCERYLGTDVVEGIDDEEPASPTDSLFAEHPWRPAAARAAAVALLAPAMQERIDRAGLRPLLTDVELPLSSVLARMQARGVRARRRLPRRYGRGRARSDGHAAIGDLPARRGGVQPELAARSCEPCSTTKLGLPPGKRTPKGQLSTDASVLEKLRDAHPIVDALL